MLRIVTLALIKRLEKLSRPPLDIGCITPEFRSSFRTFSTCFMFQDLIMERNAAPTFAISSGFCSSPSHITLFRCISIETSDHRLDFKSATGPEIKENKNSSTLMVIASTCFKVLITAPISPSLHEEKVLSLFSICLKLFKAMQIAFLAAFLELRTQKFINQFPLLEGQLKIKR
ncbi:hypothetical protein V6N13_069364 [Hibiscus sabdariffa]|uniref:Uncharacterized protein n=1 Tax=Hibiscus sabdariffa TaxID=183260 RepID=A0ABR2PGK9_9ROSI